MEVRTKEMNTRGKGGKGTDQYNSIFVRADWWGAGGDTLQVGGPAWV